MKKIITITLLLILLISSLASAELAKSKTKKVSVKLPALDSQKTDAPKKETVPTRCAREGQYTYTSAVPCCEGLIRDSNGRCVMPGADCAREGQYTYTSAVPCCEGLVRNSNGRCVTSGSECAREGQYTYTSAVPCCEGLELDDQNRCKHPTPKKFVTLPESASQGCPAELRRMQEKLNQILRIAQT